MTFSYFLVTPNTTFGFLKNISKRWTSPFDNMVVLVNIEGVDYLLDDWDKWAFVEPAGRSPHRIHSTMKMSEVGRFKKVGE